MHVNFTNIQLCIRSRSQHGPVNISRQLWYKFSFGTNSPICDPGELTTAQIRYYSEQSSISRWSDFCISLLKAMSRGGRQLGEGTSERTLTFTSKAISPGLPHQSKRSSLLWPEALALLLILSPHIHGASASTAQGLDLQDTAGIQPLCPTPPQPWSWTSTAAPSCRLWYHLGPSTIPTPPSYWRSCQV